MGTGETGEVMAVNCGGLALGREAGRQQSTAVAAGRHLGEAREAAAVTHNRASW